MRNRVKVLQLITAIGPGGAEKLLLNLVAGLDSSRFDVRIASLVDDLRALDAFEHAGMSVEVFDLTQKKLIRLKQLRDFVRAFCPDVIHAHMFHALVASVTATTLRRPQPALCFTSHNSVHRPWRSIVIRALKPWRAADIAFVQGQHRHLNVRKTFVIPNGIQVDPAPLARPSWNPTGRVRLMAVGYLSEQKDPLGLLRSFVAAKLENATLEYVGSGPLEKRLIALANELRIRERVILHGFRKDVRELLRQANVFVMHSKYEGMPMALIEAGAEAMPVVATPVGAIPAMLGTNRGILAEPGDFPMALRSLVSAPDAALKRGRRLKDHVVEHYSIGANVRAHEHLYQELYDCNLKLMQQL